MAANQYANKLFLQNAMSGILAYSYIPTNSTWNGTVTQTSTSLTIESTTPGSGPLIVGTFISITGYATVYLVSGSGSSWIVDISQTINNSATAQAVTSNNIAGTTQNLLNKFLTSVSDINYQSMYYAVVAAQYNVGNASSSKLRILVTIDDGTVAIDTSKTTNFYINFSKKITIASSTVNNNNQVNVNGTSTDTATLTIGTAGGNNINENHMSRPELLLACLSNSGVGFSSRYSTSVANNNLYLCQRVGLTTEEPNGYIRLSVPLV